MPSPNQIQRDADGTPIKAGVVFVDDRRQPYACESPATHAGIVQHQHQELYEDNLRLMRRVAELEDERFQGCPCRHTMPCDPDCTCVSPFSSRGCNRCCSYGSAEQRQRRADYLASLSHRVAMAEAKAAELEQDLKTARVGGELLGAMLLAERETTATLRAELSRRDAADLLRMSCGSP